MISIGKSPEEMRLELGERFKRQRLVYNLSRQALSEKSGVPTPTIRKFEATGEISMKSFITLSFTLDKIEEIENLMKINEPTSIEELKNKNRMRGRK